MSRPHGAAAKPTEQECQKNDDARGSVDLKMTVSDHLIARQREYDTSDNQQDSSDHAQYAVKPANVIEVALKAAGNHCDPSDRCRQNDEYLEHVTAADQCRIEDEEERHEIDDAAETHRFEPGLHRVGLGDGCRSESADGDWRRDERYHSPVHQEKVHGELVEATGGQRRCDCDGEEQIGRCNGHADAEDEARQRCHEQQEQGVAVSELCQLVGDLADFACQRQGADDEANAGEDRHEFSEQ